MCPICFRITVVDWLIDCMCHCSVDWLIDWLHVLFIWLIDWLIDCTCYSFVRLIDWLIDSPHLFRGSRRSFDEDNVSISSRQSRDSLVLADTHSHSNCNVTNSTDSSHDHCHVPPTLSDSSKKARRKLILASVLCLIFMIGEAVGKKIKTIWKFQLNDIFFINFFFKKILKFFLKFFFWNKKILFLFFFYRILLKNSN